MIIEIINETNIDIDEGLIRRAVVAAIGCDDFGDDIEVEIEIEVSVLIVDDDEMRAINYEHRGKDATTDVLAFPLELAVPTVPRHLGDIVISIDRAHAQAAEYGHCLERELAFLAVHATLHLLGHDHDTVENEGIMFALQDKILSDMGL